jgi:hypothetical protein
MQFCRAAKRKAVPSKDSNADAVISIMSVKHCGNSGSFLSGFFVQSLYSEAFVQPAYVGCRSAHTWTKRIKRLFLSVLEKIF